MVVVIDFIVAILAFVVAVVAAAAVVLAVLVAVAVAVVLAVAMCSGDSIAHLHYPACAHTYTNANTVLGNFIPACQHKGVIGFC